MNALRMLLVLLFCSFASGIHAQTERPKFVIDGMFFAELPDELDGKSQTVAIIRDGDGNSMIAVSGVKLSEEARSQALNKDSVPCAGEWLKRAESRRAENFSMTLTGSTKPRLREGDMMPEFSVTDVNGRLWTSDSLKKRPLVINFWHTGCGPCKREMPEISRWIDLCPGAVYLAVTFDSADDIRPIVSGRGFRFTQVAGDRTLWDAFGIREVPVTVLVDTDGRIKKLTVGISEQKRADMLASIRAACAANEAAAGITLNDKNN